MNASEYWALFLETGTPEAYTAYCSQLRMEKAYVSDRSGHRPAGVGLQ